MELELSIIIGNGVLTTSEDFLEIMGLINKMHNPKIEKKRKKDKILKLLTGIGYIPFTLNKNILEEDFVANKNAGDILFIHQENRPKYNHLISNGPN